MNVASSTYNFGKKINGTFFKERIANAPRTFQAFQNFFFELLDELLQQTTPGSSAVS